ncbi:hypothetical protein VE02_09310 [Pseudogymnoascus sp. 03VT05]|nr:hypothetical protein VE02_09310 [Pseudogymnoascus sp. 03VT05]
MRQFLKLGGGVVAILIQHTSAFSLYPTVDPVSLATAFNISIGCLDALNSTVTCDNYLFGWTNFVDDHWWSADNLTTLCTSTCTTSAQSWMENVFMSCLSDTLTVYGKAVPADTVAGRYTDGLGIACLQSSSSDWCIIESLNWVGSDIIRPDCSVDSTDPSCSNPANVTADNQRIANLYNDTILCDECFMKLFYERLGSDFLPDSDYSDYLVDQFQDIQDVCSTTIGELSTRGFSGYPPSTPTPQLVNITAPNPNTTITYATSAPMPTSTLLASPTTSSVVTPTPTHGSIVPSCDSFYYAVANDTCYDIALNYNITTIDFATWNSAVGVNCTGLWADYYYCVGITLDTTSRACQMIDTTTGVTSTDDFTACNQLAVLYNVPTGSLVSITGASDCYSSTGACVPAACSLMNVTENSTCVSLAADIAANSTTGNVTVTQLLSWNPYLLGTCSNLTIGQQICTGASGGSYVPPPVTNSTSDAGGQERGGPGGADPTAVTGTTVSYLVTSQVLGANPTAAPAPTQAGIAPDCNQYSKASSADTCMTFASQNGITPAELYEWNSGLGVAGANCSTNLWVDYYYCIGTVGFVAGTTTTTSSPSSTAVSAPAATQSGIISTCNAYAQAPPESYCSLFAANNGITETELYAWNSVLGAGGANCGSSFWANEYYCIGVAAPTPVQAGIIDTCNNWAAAPSGSYCSLFAANNDITEAELYAWNTALGANGANCGSSFWANEYYCIGVSLAIASTTTSVATPTAVAAPGPTQAGIVSNCNGYAMAPKGSDCSLFASDNGITLDQLYAYNTVLGADGANCGTSFWADEYYCIS